MESNRIIIGADHAGVALKRKIADYLTANGYQVEDLGSHDARAQDDYPDFAHAVARKVLRTQSKGILICTTGTGMVMAANRHKGIRAALAYDTYAARKAREDNDANILCLRGKGASMPKVKLLLNTWLKTPFSKLPRHQRRIRKLDT